MAKRSSGPDWAWGPGKSPTMGAINAAFTTANVTAIGHACGCPAWVGLAFGGAATVASVTALAVEKNRPHTRTIASVYRAACWLGAGVWSTFQLMSNPWSWTGVIALGALTAASAIFGEALRRAEAQHAAVLPKDPEPPAPRPRTPQEKIAAEWQPRIQAVTHTNATVKDVLIWPTNDGFTLGVQLPVGSTVSTIKGAETQLATAAHLPPGCNVEVVGNLPGVPRSYVHIRVNTFNVMSIPQPYTTNYSNRTILSPLHIGIAADRSPITITLLDNSGAVVGQKGSGKSNTLNVITAELVRCTNCLVVAIDTKGNGEYPRRWVNDWYRGRAERPAIHLAAVTAEQAELLCLGLLNIVRGRPTHYAQAMLARGERKIMPTPQLPQIVLVVDEFKDLPEHVRTMVVQLVDLGRSAAVEVLVSSLEATGNGIPASLMKQLRERVGMRFSDETEIQHMLGGMWRHGRFDPATMTDAGMGIVMTDARAPQISKIFDMGVDQISDVAIAVGRQRPALDAPSVDMFNEAVQRKVTNAKGDKVWESVSGLYDSWWDMVLPLMFGESRSSARPTPAPRVAPEAPAAPSRSTGDTLQALADGGETIKDALEAARRAAAEADFERAKRERKPVTDPAQIRMLNEMFAAPALSARQHYYEILRTAARPIGATEMEQKLQDHGHSTTRQTVQGWFKQDMESGKLVGEDGAYRWVGGGE